MFMWTSSLCPQIVLVGWVRVDFGHRCKTQGFVHASLTAGGDCKTPPALSRGDEMHLAVGDAPFVSTCTMILAFVPACRKPVCHHSLRRRLCCRILCCFADQVFSSEAMAALFFSSSAPTPESDPKCSPPEDARCKDLELAAAFMVEGERSARILIGRRWTIGFRQRKKTYPNTIHLR